MSAVAAGLAAFLVAQGERLAEVGRPKRPPRRTGAKSDALDAVRAAREALASIIPLHPSSWRSGGAGGAGAAGVGPISAAQVLVSWSHAGGLRSEGAFAAVAGVNPIPASSGQVTRHRLNRSGDRQLNRALRTIVLARLRDDSETRAYAARACSPGARWSGRAGRGGGQS